MSSTVLLGHNGAGKSTALAYMMGFLDTHAHEYIPKLHEHFKRITSKKVGFVPQHFVVQDRLSAYDYFALKKQKVTSNRVNEALQDMALDIDCHEPLDTYSLGMQQRFLIALALYDNPDVLVCDEPTAHVDLFGKKLIQDKIYAFSQEKEVILSTHDLHFAVHLQATIFVLKQGSMVHHSMAHSMQQLHAVMQSFKPDVLQ